MEVMDDKRFQALVATYGADAARWPDAERALALRRLASSPGAHRLRAEAKQLDDLLDAWRLDPPASDLRRRVAASAPLVRLLRPRTLWLSAAGLAAACVMGVMVGADVERTVLHAQPASDPAVTAALDGASEFTPNIDLGSTS
jgi:hypothetical protein